MKKYLYTSIYFVIFGTLLNAQKPQNVSNSKPPNFLFVLVDDQPFDTVAFSGRYPFLKTPNIDRLKNEGANVENFFVTQSICSPSRASFLTGTYPHIHGVNQNNLINNPAQASTVNRLKLELYQLKELYGNTLTIEELRHISDTYFGGLESNKKEQQKELNRKL